MNETFMKEKPVLPLLVSMALPNVISMLVNSLYNIVDSLFVARISEDAMTALSLVFPIQNFANAIAIGFGIGINAMIALYLGAGDRKKAETAATHGMALSLIHGILITILSIAIMPGFLRRFTGDESLISSGITYSTIVFLFATINMAALAFEKMFQAVGRMKVTMDRYQANWPMVKLGWETHVHGVGRQFASARDAVETYRNEENVIGQLLDSVRAQTYPADRVDIFVGADNCTDDTAGVARAHGAHVFERFNTEQVGKGYVLNDMLRRIRRPGRRHYDAYLVLDADNILDPNFLSEIEKVYSAGYEIVTCYRNSKNYGDNWIFWVDSLPVPDRWQSPDGFLQNVRSA